MKNFLRVILLGLAASVGLMVVLLLLLLGYLYLYEEPALNHFARWAEELPRQADMPVYAADGRLCLPDGTSFYPDSVLEEQYNIQQKIGYSYPVCIVGNDLYMVHTVKRGEITDWCISSISMGTKEAKLRYAWAGQSAVCDVDVAEDYARRAAWYQEGRIYMNNLTNVIIYDISAGEATIASVQEFDFPERTVWVERCDFDTDTLYICVNGKENAVTMQGLVQENPVLGEVIGCMSQKAVWGKAFADPFYKWSLHTEDGNVWLLVRGVVYGSNTWMLFMRYDAELHQWLYAGCGYSWDGIPYDYYIVPVV